MKIGDLVRLKNPHKFPGSCDSLGLLIDIEESTYEDDLTGSKIVMTVLWPPGKTPATTSNPVSRHYDLDLREECEYR